MFFLPAGDLVLLHAHRVIVTIYPRPKLMQALAIVVLANPRVTVVVPVVYVANQVISIYIPVCHESAAVLTATVENRDLLP